MVVALGTFSLGLGEGPYLRLLSPDDDDLLSLLGELADLFVGLVARVATLAAGHEDLLLPLSRQKGRPALRTELQKLFAY